MQDIELLMVHADDQRPVLDGGLPAALDDGKHRLPDSLFDPGADKNLLDQQGWGVVAPVGPEGDRLLALVDGLVRRRKDQAGDVNVYRVPPVMSQQDVRKFRDDDYLRGGAGTAPLYLLLLGDLHQVPFELQQTLMAQSLVGRIAFSNDAGYAAYAQKVVDAETTASPAPLPRGLYFNVHDGTPATAVGYRALMQPTLAEAEASLRAGKLRAKDVLEIGSGDDAGAALFAEVQKPDPAVLFSISHGLGPPRRGGWRSLDEQHFLQGAMSLGNGKTLTATDVASAVFLPGGVWFFLACYGAGTPGFGQSAYHAWLEQLEDAGSFVGADAVLAGLPKQGEPPFIAALPKAALANPRGPLAIMGHVDLAWSYSFQDVGSDARSRAARFQGIVRSLVGGDRVGIAASTLLSTFVDASVSISTALSGGGPEDPALTADRANLWMLRNDVGSYILLGDPAAQLPIVARRGQKPIPASTPSQEDFIASITGVRPRPSQPGPSPSQPGAVAPFTSASARDPFQMQKAVHALLRGDRAAKDIAAEVGASPDDLEDWRRVYTEAGLDALRRHF